MNTNEQEVEAKFYLGHPQALIERLAQAGAQVTAPRVFESNLRFDLPDGSLTRERRVLRLRQDSRARMTYKGPSQAGEQVNVRQEIEFEVSDLNAARHLLEALGYQINVMYEKYRTTYHLDEVEVVLDEMPYGMFAEIEAPSAPVIQQMADRLGLDWEARCTDSYLALFDRLCAARSLSLPHLSFENLAGIPVTPADLGLQPAN